MSDNQQIVHDAVAAAVRQNFYAFTIKVFETLNPGREFRENWHLKAIAHHVDLVREDEIRKLIINVPPRSLKSTIVSVAWPAFLLGHDPSVQIMVVSHNQQLATQLSSDFRKIVSSAWYRTAFSTMREEAVTDNELLFRTRSGGARHAVSVAMGITGIGADIIILDDPVDASNANNHLHMKSVNEWVASTLFTRYNNPASSRTVLVMQRLSVFDPTAYLQTTQAWHSLVLPAIAQEDADVPIGDDEFFSWKRGELLHADHLSAEWLKEQEGRMEADAYLAQYLQAPVPYGGGAIDLAKISRWTTPPDYHELRFISVDAASGMNNKSRTAIQMFDVEDGKLFLRLAYAKHMDFPTALERIRNLADKYEVDHILLEKGGSGQSLAEALVKEFSVGVVKLITPKMSKEERMAKAQIPLYRGKVLLPEKKNWLKEFQDELSAFPAGIYDDQVDAFSQAINWHFEPKHNELQVSYTLISRRRPFPSDW